MLLVARDLIHAAFADDARHFVGDQDFAFAAARHIVAPLDEQPVFLTFFFSGTRLEPGQNPIARQPFAMEFEFELTALQPFTRILGPAPGAAIPQHYGAAAI